MIIAEGLNLFMPMYKTYLEIKNKSIRSNEYENFYINLNNIISEGAMDNIVIGNDYVTLCKNHGNVPLPFNSNVSGNISLFYESFLFWFNDI